MVQIPLKRTALLLQSNQLLADENENLRAQLKIALEAKADEPKPGPECDVDALEKRRCYLEHRRKREIRENADLHTERLKSDFACEGLTRLLCYLQELQLWKSKLAEAELACVISRIRDCQSRDYEDCINDLLCKINNELDKCPDDVSPFVSDAINDVLANCGG